MNTQTTYVSELESERLKRVFKVREDLMQLTPMICSERATIITESYGETEGLPMIIRRAKALDKILGEMSIYIEDDQLIVGNQASMGRAAPIFPEYSINWIIDELDAFDKRPGDIFTISEGAKQSLNSIYDYWKGKTHKDEVSRTMTETNQLAEKQGVIHRGGISMSGDGHIIPNHEKILSKGFGWYIDTAQRKLSELDNTDPASENKQEFYQAAIIALNASIKFAARFASQARNQAAEEEDPRRKDELETIAQICDRIPENAPQSFHEALQMVYFCHLIMMIESNGHSFSFGRFDQYMYTFYQVDIDAGTLDPEEALELLSLFFIKLNTLNKVRPWDHTEFGVGYPLYSNLMVGGIRPDGTDGTNELSYLCIQAVDQVQLPEPNFSVRYWEGSPRRLLAEAAKLIRKGFGMPSMFGDETVVKALGYIDIPEEVARDYASIGCVEVGIPGKWTHRATGMSYINMGKILELVLNNGFDPKTGIRLLSVNEGKDQQVGFNSYDELFTSWKKFLKFYTDLAVESDRICDRSLQKHDKDPFASTLVDDCLERGMTLKDGGATYDFISHSTVGPTTVGDSLTAIKKLVYDDKILTLGELKDAMAANWKGIQAQKIQKLARSAPKFGNDDDYVDKIVASVYESYLELLPEYRTERHGKGPIGCGYTMSTSNISSNVPYGMDVGATPDGRFAGEPLNEGASICRGADREGPTAAVKSISKLPNSKMAGGQLLNMKFSPGLLKGNENLDKFVSFLEAFRQLNGFHVQFNVIDRDTLIDAMENPREYPNLMVRVAGYCALFTSLMPEVQEDIIKRTEYAEF
ncbi:MAG: pyruvate formate-lyase [Anaerolineae bacterium SM23_ 63]|nr:MAG: pyruvate formate-lyase [Anaerolineae bacterium SM23_ 63]